MMRKLYFAMCAAMLALGGCSDKGKEGPDAEGGNFAVAVTNITADAARVTITPADKQAPYIVWVDESAELTTAEAVIAEEIAYAKEYAAETGVALADVLQKGVQSASEDGLPADTEFTVLVAHVSADGVAGPITKKTFRTLQSQQTQGAFTLAASNLRAMNFTFSVKPEPSVGIYYVGVVDKEVAVADYGSDKAALAASFIEMEKGLGTDFSAPDDLWLFSGNAEYDVFLAWTLFADREYMVCVFGVSPEGEVTTEVATYDLKLPAAVKTAETITIEVSSVSDSGAVVSMEVSDEHLPYFCECFPAAEIEGMNDEQLIAYVAEQFGDEIIYATAVDDFMYDATDYLESGTKYDAVAFGYALDMDGGIHFTTAVFRKSFTTEGTGGSGDGPGEIVIPDVDFGTVMPFAPTDNSFQFSTSPIDEQMTYICFTLLKSNFDQLAAPEELIADDMAYIAKDATNYGLSFAENLVSYLRTGALTERIVKDLNAGTAYVVYAYGMSAEGVVLTRMASAEISTTGVATAASNLMMPNVFRHGIERALRAKPAREVKSVVLRAAAHAVSPAARRTLR